MKKVTHILVVLIVLVLSSCSGNQASKVSGEDYIWLTQDQAFELAKSQWTPFRIGNVDGEQFSLTEDLVPDRITVTITDWIVVSVDNW
jgi:hypothetical protein